MPHRRLLLAGVLVFLAAVVAAAAWALVLRPIEVEVVAVQRDVPIQVFGLGTVEARVVSKVGFEVAGTLVELHADHGSRVAPGTVLARLASREQDAKLAQARAAVMLAEATVTQAAATVQRAETNRRQKAQVSERRQELVRRESVSREAADDARAAFEIAAADLAQAQSAVAVARAGVEQARAALAAEDARFAKYTLSAPYEGVVITRSRELGSMVNPGEAIFTLVDPTTEWILAFVDETRAGHVEIGQGATVTLRSLPERAFHGRVARIDIESDRVNEERRIYVRCNDCPEDFHLGEQAEVVITTARIDRASLVPQSAVSGLRGRHGVVWTAEDGRLARRPVTFGQRTLDGRLEIVDGLPGGAEVAARVEPGFREGRAVTIRTGDRR